MPNRTIMTIPSEINRLQALLTTAKALSGSMAENHWETEQPIPSTVAENLSAILAEISVNIALAQNYVLSDARPAVGIERIV